MFDTSRNLKVGLYFDLNSIVIQRRNATILLGALAVDSDGEEHLFYAVYWSLKSVEIFF